MAILAKDPNLTSEDTKSGGGSSKDYTFQISRPSQTEVTLSVSVNSIAFAAAKDVAYDKLAPETKIAGFRPGKAPKNVITAKLGARLYEEAINSLLPVLTANIITESKIEPLDYADYEVKKISDAEGLVYEAKFVVLPDIKFPDFKKLKLTSKLEKVADKEVEDLFSKLKSEIIEAKKKENKEFSEKDISWDKELQMAEIKTEQDVKERLKSNLEQRKAQEFEEKQTEELIRQALLLIDIKPPKKLVEAEKQRLEKQYSERITKLGLKIEDFLKMQNTNLESLRNTWEKEAEFAIASDMMFILINKHENIQVSSAELSQEIAKIADPELRSYYTGANGQRVMASIMARQKALNRLREFVGIEVKKPVDEPKNSDHAHDHSHDHDHNHDHSHDHDHDHNHDHDHGKQEQTDSKNKSK